MSEEDEPLTMEFMESHIYLHYCRAGYSSHNWPTCMYIAVKDGDAYLWVQDRAVVSLKTHGDLRNLMSALGLPKT